MGYVLSKLYTWLYGQEEIKVIIVGLDNAGKTTTLYKLYGALARRRRRAAGRGQRLTRPAAPLRWGSQRRPGC